MSISGTYRHFKENNYEVIGEAVNIETKEVYVFYRQLYDPFEFWIRPKDMFFGKKRVGEDCVQRFVKIADKQKNILTNVDLFGLKITHTETQELYKVVNIMGEMHIVQAI